MAQHVPIGSPFAWPLFLGGALKAVYDLTLLLMFRASSHPTSAYPAPLAL